MDGQALTFEDSTFRRRLFRPGDHLVSQFERGVGGSCASPLPPPESFMDTLDPISSSFPTYRLLDETMRGELRVLLAREPNGGLKRTCLLVAQ